MSVIERLEAQMLAAQEEVRASRRRVKHLDFVTAILDAAPALIAVAKAARAYMAADEEFDKQLAKPDGDYTDAAADLYDAKVALRTTVAALEPRKESGDDSRG